MEEDPQGRTAEEEEQRRFSISRKLLEAEGGQSAENGKDLLLPGFQQEDGGYHHPSTTPLLKSVIVVSHPAEKRTSNHGVTFACPVAPFVTTL